MRLDHVARPASIFSAVAALALCLGCSSTDIGNPDNQQHYARVETHFVAESEPRSGALLIDDRLDLEEAWIGVGQLRWVTGEACTEPADAALEQTLVSELVAGTSHPAVPVATQLLPASACRVEVTLAPAEAGELPLGAPDDLVGRSIVIIGRRLDGARILVRHDATPTLTLDIADPRGFVLEEGRQSFIVGFAPQTWLDLEEVDGLLDALVADLVDPILGGGDPADALLVIDTVTNTDILDRFLASFVGSAALYHDADLDGRIDPEERTPIATAPVP